MPLLALIVTHLAKVAHWMGRAFEGAALLPLATLTTLIHRNGYRLHPPAKRVVHFRPKSGDICSKAIFLHAFRSKQEHSMVLASLVDSAREIRLEELLEICYSAVTDDPHCNLHQTPRLRAA